MYCKAIIKDGSPCTRLTVNKYCKTHTKVYEQCPICYDDMHMSSKLGCGHVFCTGCLLHAGVKCALCRAETNLEVPAMGRAARLRIVVIFDEMNEAKRVVTQIKMKLKAYSYFIRMHLYFLHNKKLVSDVRTFFTSREGFNDGKFASMLER